MVLLSLAATGMKSDFFFGVGRRFRNTESSIVSRKRHELGGGINLLSKTPMLGLNIISVTVTKYP